MTVTDIGPRDDWRPPAAEPSMAQADAAKFATARGQGAPRPPADAQRFAYTVDTVPHARRDRWADPDVADAGDRWVKRAIRARRRGDLVSCRERLFYGLELQARLAGFPVRLPRRPFGDPSDPLRKRRAGATE